MESICVVHIGVPLVEQGDCNGQVLYRLAFGILEVGQDQRISVHPAEDLPDADLLPLAGAVDIGELDRGRRGTFGHSIPVPRVGFGGRQELTGGIRAVRGGIVLVDPQASLIVLDDPDLGYRPRRRRSRRIGSWSRLSPSPSIGRSCHCALSRMSGGSIFGPNVTRSKAPFISVSRRPARYATSHPNPVTGALDQVWSSVLFDA